ncbi:glycosyltransferase family 2 protein [Pseudomonas sp. LRF_L74]|uniref:glycosyltransferase family 2 protein n=1 Tax=Pseudomonas sp. LRF_L74 TaxID=3369422 RepID=UPI003F5F062B
MMKLDARSVEADMQYPSVVIEWDNALLSGNNRAFKGLSILNQQLWDAQGHLSGEADVVVTFDPSQADEALIRREIERIGGKRGWPGHLTVATVPPGTRYYGHKNIGFRFTRNDIVIFLDSDLLPESGWLEEMIRPFADYRHSVVVGNTYMDFDRFYARCVGLFWIFETRSTERELSVTDWLVSNNIAFRRKVFERLPFPERVTFRGQCSELGRLLAANGILLYRNPMAQAAHPPPNGIRHFVERASYSGHDECSYRRLCAPVGVANAWARFRFDLGVVNQRVTRRAPVIGAKAGTRLAARVLGAVFYLIKLIAYALTVFAPTAVRRIFGAATS